MGGSNIEVCMKPLLEKNAVERSYVDAIIERTKELGPFYVLAQDLQCLMKDLKKCKYKKFLQFCN